MRKEEHFSYYYGCMLLCSHLCLPYVCLFVVCSLGESGDRTGSTTVRYREYLIDTDKKSSVRSALFLFLVGPVHPLGVCSFLHSIPQ